MHKQTQIQTGQQHKHKPYKKLKCIPPKQWKIKNQAKQNKSIIPYANLQSVFKILLIMCS